MTPAAFSCHADPSTYDQEYASGLHSLRPCCLLMLSIQRRSNDLSMEANTDTWFSLAPRGDRHMCACRRATPVNPRVLGPADKPTVPMNSLYVVAGCTLPPPTAANGPVTAPGTSRLPPGDEQRTLPLLLIDSQAICARPRHAALLASVTQTRVMECNDDAGGFSYRFDARGVPPARPTPTTFVTSSSRCSTIPGAGHAAGISGAAFCSWSFRPTAWCWLPPPRCWCRVRCNAGSANGSWSNRCRWNSWAGFNAAGDAACDVIKQTGARVVGTFDRRSA